MREGPYRLISERGCVQMKDEKGREDFADELVREATYRSICMRGCMQMNE